MDWKTLIIPVIAIGMWVISSLIKKAESQRKKPPAPPEGTPSRPPSRAELDRFLEEVNQQRQRRAKQANAASREPRPPRRPKPVREMRRAEALPEVIPVGMLVTQVPPPVQVTPGATPRTPPPAKPPLNPFEPSKVTVRREPVSANLLLIKELLATESGLRTAFILREIFGPPRSLRPNRR